MDDQPLKLVLALAAGVIAGFGFGGFLLGQAIGTPAPGVTAFLGSIVLLFFSVLLLDTLHLPLSLSTLGTTLCGACALLLLAARWKRSASDTPDPRTSRIAWPRSGADWLWLVPPLLAAVSVCARAWIDPLSGYDNPFRWNNLSLLLLSERSLQFYPPVSAQDFGLYPWCDGIPPLVSILNYWLYLAAGTTRPEVSVLRVGLELALVGRAIHGYATQLWSFPQSGWIALASLATSSLFLWGVAMGQETALTALSLVSTLWFAAKYHEAPHAGTAAWAGIAAAVGGLAREYGLAFIPLGALAVGWRSPSRRGAWIFLASASAVAAPWYLRNAWVTGNPAFNQDAFGLFPFNGVQAAWMRESAAYWGLAALSMKGVAELLATLLALAGALVVIAIPGAVAARARGLILDAGIVLVIWLWIWSIDQTAGGWTYSMRVLTPALALAAVLAGWLAAPAAARVRIAALCLMIPLSADAARRAWHLPQAPFTSATRYSFDEWRLWRDRIRAAPFDPLWDQLVPEARGEGILVDHPLFHEAVRRRGGRAIPWFSPDAAAIFDPALPFPRVVDELRRHRVRFLAMMPDAPVNRTFVEKQPFLRALWHSRREVGRVGGMLVFDLARLAEPLHAAEPP